MIYAPIEYTLTPYQKQLIAQYPYWYYPFKGRGTEKEFYILLGFSERYCRGKEIALIVDTDRTRFHERCLSAYIYLLGLRNPISRFALRDLVANWRFDRPVIGE